MSWQRRRVLVTGASGIVGSWLVKRLLQEGASVVVLLRDWDPQSELVRSGDLRLTAVVSGALEDFGAVERAVNEHEVDTVFHLGAQTIVGTARRSPLPTFEANIRGTYHLLEACRLHGDRVRRVVVASSDKAYGDLALPPYTEEMPLRGRQPYDVSKSCADLIALAYAHSYGLPVCVARCGNIYGGGDLNWSRLVPGTIRSLLENQRPVLRSDGLFVREYLYVLDAVEAYMLLADQCPEPTVRGEAFNIGTERRLTAMEMVHDISELMERTDLEPIICNQAEGEMNAQSLDSRKIRRVLDWSPRYELRQGLRETIQWYRAYFERGR